MCSRIGRDCWVNHEQDGHDLFLVYRAGPQLMHVCSVGPHYECSERAVLVRPLSAAGSISPSKLWEVVSLGLSKRDPCPSLCGLRWIRMANLKGPPWTSCLRSIQLDVGFFNNICILNLVFVFRKLVLNKYCQSIIYRNTCEIVPQKINFQVLEFCSLLSNEPHQYRQMTWFRCRRASNSWRLLTCVALVNSK